jgi:hypothetical protein
VLECPQHFDRYSNDIAREEDMSQRTTATYFVGWNKKGKSQCPHPVLRGGEELSGRKSSSLSLEAVNE